jgi:hypothetical protein
MSTRQPRPAGAPGGPSRDDRGPSAVPRPGDRPLSNKRGQSHYPRRAYPCGASNVGPRRGHNRLCCRHSRRMCAPFPFRHLYGAARWRIVAQFSSKSGLERPDLGSRYASAEPRGAMSKDRATTCREEGVGIGGSLVPLPRATAGPLMVTNAISLDAGRPPYLAAIHFRIYLGHFL